MTRTARSASLRSILKDRSESKTGLNNNVRKNGGGAHNWGSLENEVGLYPHTKWSGCSSRSTA
jgi:hypothetical protein